MASKVFRTEKMNRVFVQSLVCVGGFFLAARCCVGAAQVVVQETHYNTYVSRGVWVAQDLVLESRTLESSDSLSDSLGFEPGWVNARAEAGWLRLSAFAAADYPLHDTSSASAGSAFTFSPQADTVAPIGIEITGWDHYFFSSGSVSLVDLTANSVLWDFDWDGSSGTVPWLDHGADEPRGTASLILNTTLFELHDYRFSMFAGVGSQEPSSPRIEVVVSGLEVPEPSTFALASLGATALLMRRSRQR
jgi:hypothetical protein